MIKNIKGLALFFASVFVFGLVFSFIPTQVFATASGYTCSDGDYDPREGSASSSPTLYYVEHQHNWGVCKSGDQPVAPITASGYVCSGDNSYDPREGTNYNGVQDQTGYSAQKAQYIAKYKHEWGLCKDGSTPIAPATASSSNTTNSTADNVRVNVDTCNSGFLGFPAWYRGLTNKDCDVVSPVDASDGSGISLSGFIWTIVLNVVEMAMVAVAYVTVFFILYGGFQFLTSQGAPEGMAKAKTTITNAVIGLIISLVAVGLINYIVTGLLI